MGARMIGLARGLTIASVGLTLLGSSFGAQAREAQLGDLRGGHGRDDVRIQREAQPGDDRGGHHRDDVTPRREREPGDDHGRHHGRHA